MRRSFWNKRVPTLLVLFFLTIAIGVTSLLANTNTRTIGKANENVLPYAIQVTNITDRSFTVTYITSQAVSGVIAYGDTAEGSYTAYDDRDKEPAFLGLYNNHHITVKNLLPQTTHFFSIKSDSKEFLNDTVPFAVTTVASLTRPQRQMESILGTVVTNDYSQDNGIVFVKSNASQTLSQVVQADGTYSISLEEIRNEDLSSYATISTNTLFDLSFVNHREKSKAAILAGNASRIPPVVLSKNYDFTIDASPTPLITEQSRFPTYQLGFDQSASPQAEINLRELLKNSLQTPRVSSSSSQIKPLSSGFDSDMLVSQTKPLSSKHVLSDSAIQIPLQFSTMIFITAIVITVIIGMLLFIISRQTSLL